jgi:hypothetical protein
MLIDLPGCSHELGLPTADREYALEGRAIKTRGESLRNCLKCGYTQPSALRSCEGCGNVFPRREYNGPKIWNLELEEYFQNVGDLESAPKSLKQLEWDRLLAVCDSKRFGISFAVQEFEKTFKAPPPDSMLKALGDERRLAELRRLHNVQKSRGLALGWVSHAYRQTFGGFPSRALREQAGIPLPPPQDAR